MPIRVRFVGGCWHNMLPLLTSLPATMSSLDGVHLYHLAEFYTEWCGTPYYQYIHESFVKGSRVSIRTCRENFPAWELPIENLDKFGPRWATKQRWGQN